MRRLRLRSQLAVVAAFLAVYALAIAASFRFEERAQDQLEHSFELDLAALTRLPRLGDLLREEALLSQQYLLTGRPEWTGERQRALIEIKRLEREIEPLLADPREHELWRRLLAQTEDYLREQDQWIERKRQGRLTPGSTVEVLSRSDAIEGLVEVLLALRDQNTLALQARREAARRASRWTFALTLATGLLIGALLMVFVSWYVIGPLTRLETYAREWALGREWSLAAPQTGPEIQSLFSSMGELARRLNEEYSKERDLARFKSQLVSMVSHEFSNALSIISGAAVLLEDTEGEKPEKRGQYYAMLKANVQALGAAAQNLLNMGRLESGRFALSLKRTLPSEIVRPVVQRLELLSLRKRQTVRQDVQSGLPVLADPDALSLVLTNLLGNAIKYSPEGGTIVVSVRLDSDDPGRAWLGVSDTGIGIKPEDKERIFSGFYRTEDGRQAAKGFGVGLSLAKRIVEAHDSVLRVESEPGKGSTFWFTLPLWTEAAQLRGVS